MEGEVRFTLLDEDGVEKEVKVFFFLIFFLKENCLIFEKMFLFFPEIINNYFQTSAARCAALRAVDFYINPFHTLL